MSLNLPGPAAGIDDSIRAHQIMLRANITSITEGAFTDILLEAPAGYSFQAGQYAPIGEASLPFSIASAPERLPTIRFLFRHDGSDAAAQLSRELKQQTIRIGVAAGDVTRPATETRPLSLVCAGTGISQALSLLAAEAGSGRAGESRLYWARSEADAGIDWISLCPAAAEASPIEFIADDPSIGPRNQLQQQLILDARHLKRTDIIVCGPPAFAYQSLDSLVGAGVPEAAIRADAFSYAPRTSAPGAG
ncbi:MAG: hypothetical protein NXH85_10070 [Pseudomonadaceae bacterium]|nr:hypothetical protein [Pseudomonadaceae bacterium]